MLLIVVLLNQRQFFKTKFSGFKGKNTNIENVNKCTFCVKHNDSAQNVRLLFF